MRSSAAAAAVKTDALSGVSKPVKMNIDTANATSVAAPPRATHRIFTPKSKVPPSRISTTVAPQAREDRGLTWGIGVHPGVASACACYDPDRFRALLPRLAIVGEGGLDRRAARQDALRVFADVLQACHDRPMLISVHSRRCRSHRARPTPRADSALVPR
jgi:Tat protein secretion system quality control protein TatD with DNase activity